MGPQLPPLADLLATATPFALPLLRPFRGLTLREGVLINGPSGWGEFAPFDDYSDAGAARWLRCAVESAFGSWPAPQREVVTVNAILPSLPVGEVPAWVQRARHELGATTVKVKVAEESASDAERLRLVRAGLGPEGRIRIDCNARWTLAEATARIPELAAAAEGIEYVEQPLDDLGEMAELRARVGVPLAVDEGLRRADDLDDPALPDRIRAAGDVLVVKAAPIGGVRRALELAERVGLPVVVSGSLDSSVGLAPALALAGAVPRLEHACGLGTGALFAADLCADPVLPRGGMLAVSRVDPDPDLLAAAATRVSPERRAYWDARLRAAYEVAA